MRVEGPKGAQVSTEVVRGPRADRVDVGTDIYKGLGSAAGTVFDAAADAKKRADEASAEEALTAFEREKNSLLMDPDTGYFAKAGRDAYDGAETVKGSLEQLRKKYEDGLSSTRSRELFGRAATAHITRGLEQVDAHALKGLRGWEAANAESELENHLANAMLYWNQSGDPTAEDPKQRFGQLQVGAELATDAVRQRLRGQGKGEDPETITNEVIAFQSKYYANAVRGALRSSLDDAQKVFDRFDDKIKGEERLRVLDAMAGRAGVEKDAKLAAQVTGYAQSIFQSVKGREAGIRAAMSIEDKAISGKVVKEVAYLYSQQETAEKEDALDTYRYADEWLRGNPGSSVRDLIDADQEGWARLTPTQKERLEDRAGVKSDLVWFHNTVTLPDEDLLQVSIDEATKKLDDEKLGQFTSAYKAAAQRMRKGESPSKSTISVEAHVGVSNSVLTKRAAESILGNSRDWNAEDNRKAALFYSMVDERARLLAGPDRKLDSGEYGDLLKELSAEVKKQGKWFGFIPVESEYTIDNVPYDQQLRIRKILRENGKATNARNIVQAWQDGLGEPPEEE